MSYDKKENLFEFKFILGDGDNPMVTVNVNNGNWVKWVVTISVISMTVIVAFI